MKSKLAIMLSVLVIMFSILIASVLFDHLKNKEELDYKFDINLVLPNNGGFNLDKDKIHFGDVCEGCSGIRTMTIFNNHTYREKITFLIGTYNTTDVGSWFNIKPAPNFILEPNQSVEFKIAVTPSKNSSLGLYEGYIIIMTYKAWSWEKNQLLVKKLSGCWSDDFMELIYSCGN